MAHGRTHPVASEGHGPCRTKAFKKIAVFVTLLLLPAAGPFARAEAAGQGIRGRASHGGVLVEGLVVRTYPYRPGTFGPLTGEQSVAQTQTATDGTYRLALPPGRYVVEGIKKAPGNRDARPERGDLYCLYAGSPVVVGQRAWTAVGLNLVRVPRETREPAATSRIRGTITVDGRPADKVYLYLYADPATGLRGPARLLKPVPAGAFQVRTPPGTYYLVARKRARGGPYGPVAIGDRFNFYPRNPVKVGERESVTVEIPLVERLSQLEEDPDAYQGVPVRVVGPDGAPRKGYYVLAYPSPTRSGPPLATGPATDADGITHLPVEPGRVVFLRARRSLGGPLGEGEPFGDGELGASAGARIVIRAVE